MKKKNEKIKGIVPYSFGAASLAMSYIVISNLTFALTESYSITAVTAGMIFLVSRFLDGFSDIIGGFIIDRTNTRFGKARPFDLVAIPLWIFVVISFSVPNIGTVGKIIWVFLAYNLSQTVCYTLVAGATPVRIKYSFHESFRVKVVSMGAFAATLISTFVAVLFPILASVLKDRPYGWTILASCFAVPGIIMMLCQFFLVRETEVEEKVEQEKLSFMESVHLLFKNPSVFIAGLAFMMVSIANSAAASVNYYFTYVIGNLQLAAVVSLISVLGMSCVVFMPLVNKKYGSVGTVRIGFLFIAVFHSLKYVIPTNIIWLAICTAFASLGIIFVQGMKSIIIIDCMQIGYKKTGKMVEGLYASVNGFVDKVGLGLGSFLLGLILQIGKYDGNLDVQPSSANTAIQFVYAALPAICGLFGFIVISVYARVIAKTK